MDAEEKVVMVFRMTTGWTVRTVSCIAVMDNSTNRKYAMSPLEKEVRTMLIAVANGRVEGPVNV